MGGPGSTRWQGHEKKTTVEECLNLPIRFFTSRDLIQEGTQKRGLFKWKDPRSGERVASVTYEVDYQNRNPVLWLFFACRLEGNEVKGYERIELESTSPHYGGNRWWMLCPSPRDEVECNGNRCGKLYLPPGAVFFACRECHDLTYESCQENPSSDFTNDIL